MTLKAQLCRLSERYVLNEDSFGQLYRVHKVLEHHSIDPQLLEGGMNSPTRENKFGTKKSNGHGHELVGGTDLVLVLPYTSLVLT